MSGGVSVFISGVTGFNSESDLPPDPTLSTKPEERADNRFCIRSSGSRGSGRNRNVYYYGVLAQGGPFNALKRRDSDRLRGHRSARNLTVTRDLISPGLEF
jgi:hypothetical protein